GPAQSQAAGPDHAEGPRTDHRHVCHRARYPFRSSPEHATEASSRAEDTGPAGSRPAVSRETRRWQVQCEWGWPRRIACAAGTHNPVPTTRYLDVMEMFCLEMFGQPTAHGIMIRATGLPSPVAHPRSARRDVDPWHRACRGGRRHGMARASAGTSISNIPGGTA